MAVKIDIPGVGEVVAENAASEATLREILKTLGGKSYGMDGGGGMSGTGKNAEEAAKQVKKHGEASERAGVSVDGFADRLDGFVGGIWNTFTAAIGAVVGSTVGLGFELLKGGNQLSDFAQHLPIPGLTAFSGLIDGQINLFRELSQSGASFGNNMFEITRIAGNAAIPQEEFAELLRTQSSSLRLFGSSVNDGARNFASMSKEMRQGGIGPRLMAMGFTSQELNENFIAYNEMMTVSGRRQFMSNAQLIEGSQNYSLELDKISKLTGKSREQLQEEMRQKNMDIRRQMAIAKYGEQYALRLQQAAEVGGPAFEAAVLDMADGVENDPLTRQLMANNEAFRNGINDVQNMTAEEFTNFAASVRQSGMEYANSMGENAVQASIANGTAVGELFQLTGALGRATGTVEGGVSAEQQARDDATAAVATFAETVNDVRGRLQVDLLDSNIFQDLKNGLASLIPSIDEANTLYDDMESYFMSNIFPALDNMWTWLKTDGMTMLKDSMESAWNWLKTDGVELMDTAFTKMTEAWNWLSSGEGYTMMQNAITGLTELWDSWKPSITGFFENLTSAEGRAEIWQSIVDGTKSALSSIFTGVISMLGWDQIGPTYTDLKDSVIATLTDWKDKFVEMFTWENIRSTFTIENIGTALGAAVRGVYNWITGLFDFDFSGMISSVIPDWAKRWLPDSWFGGPSSSSPSTSSPDPSSAIPEPEQSSSSAPSPTNDPAMRTASNARSNSENPVNDLNTNTARMVALLEQQNRLLQRMDGNLYG